MTVMGPGKTDEWYTPPEIFAALNTEFDLDVATPGAGKTHVPCHYGYTKRDDGLKREWFGFVWMNPPFGGRNGQFPWLEKFIAHGNGIGLCTALTEGFQKYMPQMDAILFPKGKTRFIDENGKRGGCPFNGIVLFAIGKKGVSALENSKLGVFARMK
jgi:hypothetical protein